MLNLFKVQIVPQFRYDLPVEYVMNEWMNLQWEILIHDCCLIVSLSLAQETEWNSH